MEAYKPMDDSIHRLMIPPKVLFTLHQQIRMKCKYYYTVHYLNLEKVIPLAISTLSATYITCCRYNTLKVRRSFQTHAKLN